METATVGTVWVVDDEAYTLQLCSFILKKNGIPHRCFDNAADVLKADWDPAVTTILADIHIPALDGVELCHALRRRYASALTIIAFTGKLAPEDDAELLNSGFDRVLFKPFTESELLNVIRGTENDECEDTLQFPLLDELITDPADRKEILQQFRDDTYADLETLKTAVETNDHFTTSLIVHKLAGRIGQFSQEELSLELRQLESALKTQPEVQAHAAALSSLQERVKGLCETVDRILHSMP